MPKQKKKILFLVGSLNQTTQMHQIASHLEGEYECYFSHVFSNHPTVRFLEKAGLLANTILSESWRKRSYGYLEANGQHTDHLARQYRREYALVVNCTDMLIPKMAFKTKTVFVQEGMTDGMTRWSKFVKKAGLPTFLAGNTSLNGSSNNLDVYCAASGGYKKLFSDLGTDPAKIVVTGIPNFDHVARHLNNDFPHHGHVLVATSDIRECHGKEDRPAFIRNCVQIANGRRLIFRFHPNEKRERAIREVRENAPADSLCFTDGSTADMVANCSELITQYSTVVYWGIALGKPVHSFFDVDNLKRLCPVQTGGQSAKLIASVCRDYVEYEGSLQDYHRHHLPRYQYTYA